MLSARQYIEESDIILQSDNGDVILNEIYFGQIPPLLVLEDLIDKLKTSYRKIDIYKDQKDYRKLINDPILRKIGQKICETFGFKDAYITISKDDYINAYTTGVPVDQKGATYDEKEVPFDYKKLTGTVKITNSGFKFDSRKFKINILVCFTYGILFKSDITTKELIAVLLHEIGHIFSKVIYENKLLTGRVDEKFADNFASMYGYSEYLISAFSKMSISYEDTEKIIKQVPLIGSIVGLNRAFNTLLYRTMVNDEHPTLYRRMEDQINNLENELKTAKNMSPEMRQDLQNQIQRSRQIMDNFFNNHENDDLTDRIVKGTTEYLEPNHPFEKMRDNEANSVASPDKINKRVGKIYHKKGFFR